MYVTTSPRRLPIVAKPQASESFTSWLTRLARLSGVPTGAIVDALGLPVRPCRSDARPAWADILLTSTTVDRVHHGTGVTGEQLAQTHLSNYHGRILNLSDLDPGNESSLRGVATREWILTGHTRACVQCVAGDGAWQTWWRLGLAGICPRHGQVLTDSCARCGAQLGTGPIFSRHQLAGAAHICPRQISGTRCGYDLTDTQRPVVGPQAAKLQAMLIADTPTRKLAGARISVNDWSHELTHTINALRGTSNPAELADAPEALNVAWEAERVRLAGHVGGPVRAATPANADLAAALLCVVAPVFTAPDSSSARESLAGLVQHIESMPHTGKGNRAKNLESLPVLGPLVAQVRPRRDPIVSQLRAGRRPPLDVDHIPALLEEDVYLSLFAPLLPGTRTVTGRRYCALAVARTVTDTWAKAAAALDIPVRAANNTTDALRPRITNIDDFAQAVRTTAITLSRQRINYGHRRRVLADLNTLTSQQLSQEVGLRPTKARCRNAAAYGWVCVCGGEPANSPALAAARRAGARSDSLTETYRRFTASLTKDQRASIASIALQMTEEIPWAA